MCILFNLRITEKKQSSVSDVCAFICFQKNIKKFNANSTVYSASTL